LERRGDGPPWYRVPDQMAPAARTGPRDEEHLDGGRGELRGGVHALRADLVVAEAGAEAAPADLPRRTRAEGPRTRRRLLRRVVPDQRARGGPGRGAGSVARARRVEGTGSALDRGERLRRTGTPRRARPARRCRCGAGRVPRPGRARGDRAPPARSVRRRHAGDGLARIGSRTMELRVLGGVSEAPREGWNALVRDGSPFLEWEWLATLEET